MRNRMIKPEFWTSEQVVECSPITRLLFIGMWNFCDDNGIHPASPKTLKMEVFPGDDITVDQVQESINQLIENELLAEYEAENRHYWIVTGWHHQKIDKPTLRHPVPEIDYHSAIIRRDVGEGSARPRPERKGKEEKRKEEKEKGKESETDPPPPPELEKKIEAEKDFPSDLAEMETWYASLLGRIPPLSSKNIDSIRQALSTGLPHPDIKAIVTPIFQKQKEKGNQIRNFSYFLPAVVEEAQRRKLLSAPIAPHADAAGPGKPQLPTIDDEDHFAALVTNGIFRTDEWANGKEMAEKFGHKYGLKVVA